MFFIILGGNDCNFAWNTKEICAVQNNCKDFAVICRNAFPNAKLIFFQVEDRLDPTTWEIDLDHKRKGNKFNKLLNKFEGKAALNPQVPNRVYKPPLVYCRMGFINTLPFPALHLSRNAAIVSESLKISDQRMAK